MLGVTATCSLRPLTLATWTMSRGAAAEGEAAAEGSATEEGAAAAEGAAAEGYTGAAEGVAAAGAPALASTALVAPLVEQPSGPVEGVSLYNTYRGMLLATPRSSSRSVGQVRKVPLKTSVAGPVNALTSATVAEAATDTSRSGCFV